MTLFRFMTLFHFMRFILLSYESNHEMKGIN